MDISKTEIQDQSKTEIRRTKNGDKRHISKTKFMILRSEICDIKDETVLISKKDRPT